MTVVRLAGFGLTGLADVRAPAQGWLGTVVGGETVDACDAIRVLIADGGNPDQPAGSERSAFKKSPIVSDAANAPAEVSAALAWPQAQAGQESLVIAARPRHSELNGSCGCLDPDVLRTQPNISVIIRDGQRVAQVRRRWQMQIRIHAAIFLGHVVPLFALSVAHVDGCNVTSVGHQYSMAENDRMEGKRPRLCRADRRHRPGFLLQRALFQIETPRRPVAA